jgi:predicted nucleic acid-binding protein
VPERWVINASPVILLSKASVIHLLPRLCDELIIPSGVVDEVAVGERGDLGRKWLAGEGAPFVRSALPLTKELVSAELGQGEAEVLSWALTHNGFKAVLDDRQGRIWARKLNLPLIGSLGVVVLMKQRGLISSAKPILQKIRDAGGYVSEASIQAALAKAGEI